MTKIIKLLYAEDNPQDADLAQVYFAEHAPEFELQIVSTGAACFEQMKIAPPDILLLDHKLPDTDSIEMLKKLKLQKSNIPVVIVTGVGDEELVVRALRLGAVNYIPKRGSYVESIPSILHNALSKFAEKEKIGLAPIGTSRRILFVEHKQNYIDIALRHFSETAPHFIVTAVHSCAEALVHLTHSDSYDLLLIELRMPDQSGLEFLGEANRRRLKLPPFIIITDTSNEEVAIAAMSLGAVDYITKFEEHLNQLNYRIENAIGLNQLIALNQQLREAKNTAENATLIKTRFLAIAAHELRTPVTAFSLLLQLTQKQLENGFPVEASVLTKLLAQADKLSKLVVDLFDVTRLERGLVKLNLERKDVNSVITECVEDFKLREPDRMVKIIKPETPVEFKFDSLRINQVISNLLENARKYTPQQSPVEITVETKPSSVLISVTDHGPGISDEQKTKLFNPFNRGSDDLTSRSAGLGLGLYVCSEIIKLHGGTIGVISKMGEGSTFYFELPTGEAK